jgi:hypothetical protein
MLVARHRTKTEGWWVCQIWYPKKDAETKICNASKLKFKVLMKCSQIHLLEERTTKKCIVVAAGVVVPRFD